MGILTTCIGAYPKPAYAPVVDWFAPEFGADTSRATALYKDLLNATGDAAEDLFISATQEVIQDQVKAGIDIPTDGEVRRENYIHYHCRHLTGIDFDQLTPKKLRNGAYETRLPTITGPIRPSGDPFLIHDFKIARSFTDRPIKMTVPGPLTIADTTADNFYGDATKLGEDLADAINFEVRALADAGCRNIQIDEPLFARNVKEALAFGIDHLIRCFHGLAEGMNRVVHICCGYPSFLDETDYDKADPQAYFDLAEALDAAPIDQISIEDAHRPNDLTLLERFAGSTVILGVVAVAQSRVETIDEIRQRLLTALNYIDRHRLIAAPDCGLGLLGRDLARKKLKNLCEAAHNV